MDPDPAIFVIDLQDVKKPLFFVYYFYFIYFAAWYPAYLCVFGEPNLNARLLSYIKQKLDLWCLCV